MSIIVSKKRESKIETTLQQTAQILAEFAVGGPTQEELTKAKLRAEVDLSCNLQDYSSGVSCRVVNAAQQMSEVIYGI